MSRTTIIGIIGAASCPAKMLHAREHASSGQYRPFRLLQLVRKRRKKKTKKKIAMPHLIFGEDTLVEAPAPPFTAPHRLLSSSGMN